MYALLKQKHEKEQIQVQYRNGAKDVLFLESKMFFFQEQIMIYTRPESERKKEHFF
jgi:hypothetical protein